MGPHSRRECAQSLWGPEYQMRVVRDFAEFATQCRFSDCSHETEPGCAIQAALAEGRLAPRRWRSYRELHRELAELEERLARRERSRARRRPGAGAP